MDKWKIVKISVVVLLVIAVGLFLHKNLPRTAVVQIEGTDVKRIDKATGKPKAVAEKSQDAAPVQTHDVRFINTMSRDNKVMVFRNEDTGWGWPFYFKFDSADVTAEAQSFANAEKKPWVLVKYYGWRIRMFSMFPNVVSMKEVDKDYRHIPWFNIIFLILLVVLALFVRRKFKQLIEKMRNLKLFKESKPQRA